MPPVFITTLLTITKTWKQSKHPLTGVWMKKMWYACVCVYKCIHTHKKNGILLSKKKNEIMPFAAT